MYEIIFMSVQLYYGLNLNVFTIWLNSEFTSRPCGRNIHASSVFFVDIFTLLIFMKIIKQAFISTLLVLFFF